MWIEDILWDKKYGMDVYRCKGILSVVDSDQLYTIQVKFLNLIQRLSLIITIINTFSSSTQLAPLHSLSNFTQFNLNFNF